MGLLTYLPLCASAVGAGVEFASPSKTDDSDKYGRAFSFGYNSAMSIIPVTLDEGDLKKKLHMASGIFGACFGIGYAFQAYKKYQQKNNA